MNFNRLLILLLLTSSFTSLNQDFFRVKASFSIKEKLANGKSAMQVGTVYYDLNYKKLIYEFTFPKKEIQITTDSCSYRIENDTLAGKSMVPGFIQQSIFHLALTGDLKNFGLDKSALKIGKVERDKDMVITTWIPEAANKIFKGKILVSTKNNKLFGVVYLDEKDELLSKQFYEDYETISGLSFPKKIVYILYSDGQKNFKTIEFRKITLNEEGNKKYYNYPIPN